MTSLAQARALEILRSQGWTVVPSDSSRGGPIVMEKDGKRISVRPDGSHAEVK
jgi:hypothetical protein